MKNIILIISVFTTFLIAEKWEYLICQNNISFQKKSDKIGFKVLSDNKSKYNNLFNYEDFYSLEKGYVTTHNQKNGLTIDEILINSLNQMGNDGWEIFDVQGTNYHFKRKVLEPIIKK